MWKVVAVFFGALIVGFAATRGVRKSEPDGSEGAAVEDGVRFHHRESWRPEDFRKWINSSSKNGNPDAESDFAQWREKEIQCALEEGLSNAGLTLPGGTAWEVMNSLFCEWVKRNPDAALDWFDALPIDGVKCQLSGALAQSWPKDRAEEGLAYAYNHREWFKTDQFITYPKLMVAAMNAAAMRGPNDVNALIHELNEHGFETRYGGDWSFPSGFDFNTLIRLPAAADQLAKGPAFFAEAWLKQDREAAFQNLFESGNGVKGQLANQLFSHVFPFNEEDTSERGERTRWLVAKLDAMEPEQRRKIAMESVNVLRSCPPQLGEFVAALSDPDDRQAVSSGAFKLMLGSSIDPTLEFLEKVPDGGERLELLENSEPMAAAWAGMLVPGQEKLLREKLAAWNASADRVESIMHHLKGGRR